MDFGGPTGLLELAFTAVQDINRRSQDVTIHRQQCMQLAKRSAELVNMLRDEQQTMDDSKMREAVDELEEVLLKIRKRVIEWANLNRVKSFMRQDQIATELDVFNQTLDTHVTKFQIVSSIELNRQQRRMDLYRQHDHEEVKEMLRALVRNVEDLQVAVGMRDDVPALMETIQVELKDEQPGTEEYKALRGGLNTLHNKTGILPPLTNLTGQVIRLSEHPAAEGGMADIYEGQWVGDEKVMLKAIRHVESESAVKRFRHEIDIWRRLQHIHVLRFYGVCYIGPRLYAVAPWADNGNLLVYLRKNPYSDRMALLSEVALGLMYLHAFKPTIVHGDLRAANVLVSATGEALLTDFGLSKILAEEEGPGVASTSLTNAGSARWMAPELFEAADNQGYMVSTASDVWSFGMLCLEVLTSQSPYRQCRVDGQAIAKILDRKLPDRPERTDEILQRGLSDSMWRLMNRCWAWDPAARPHMRTLGGDVRKLHMEHLRHYGAIGENNNIGSPPASSTLFQTTSALATPPSSSTHSLSPSSLPLQLSPGLHESPSPYMKDLPSPTFSETPRNNTIGTGGVPIPNRRPEPINLFSQQTMSDMEYGSLNSGRSPTEQIWMEGNRYRAGTLVSRASDLAGPHPDGQDRINYDPDGRVLNGNLEGLVDRLLINSPATRMDEEFRECFLTVYRGFARADDLLPMLIERYKARAFGFMPERERMRLRKNMIVVLSKWLEIQEIEPKDIGFLQEMEAFVKNLPSEGSSDVERRDLQKSITEQFQKLHRPSPLPPTNSGQRIKFSELDARSIAKQLMRIESDLFQKILASDCAAWVKNVADEQLQNLPRFMKNNYKIADWCQSMILFLDSNEIEQRAHMIIFFKRVAEECIKIRSFSTAHAILAGLSTDFINSLGYTWRLVDKRTKDSLKEISALVSDVDRYKDALNSDLRAPSVPILTIHLRELRRTYREMETHVIVDGEPLVNFQKFEEVWKSIKSIMQYKSPRPAIPNDAITLTYLNYELSKVSDGVELQNRFKNRSEELKRKEQRDFNNRRLGMEDAGFRPPKSKKK
ncbi:RasGEF domain protein [Ceratobasidium sp. AG-Ba]|nr:RasGEF domain protein [Ceratobasidium sp. AG-Ba]